MAAGLPVTYRRFKFMLFTGNILFKVKWTLNIYKSLSLQSKTKKTLSSKTFWETKSEAKNRKGLMMIYGSQNALHEAVIV